MDPCFSATAGALSALPADILHHILADVVDVRPLHAYTCKRFLASVRHHLAKVPAALVGKVTTTEMAYLKAAVSRLDLSGSNRAATGALLREVLGFVLPSADYVHRFVSHAIDNMLPEGHAWDLVDNYTGYAVLALSVRVHGYGGGLARDDFVASTMTGDGGDDALLDLCLDAYRLFLLVHFASVVALERDPAMVSNAAWHPTNCGSLLVYVAWWAHAHGGAGLERYRAQYAAVLGPLGARHIFVPKPISCDYSISDLSDSLRAAADAAALHGKLHGMFGARGAVEELEVSASGGIAPVLSCVSREEVRDSCTEILASMVNDHFFDVCWS